MITIKRLYIENYKLFSQKEIDFSGALLSVFDGPNGYGKTSIFDAIEFSNSIASNILVLP